MTPPDCSKYTRNAVLAALLACGTGAMPVAGHGHDPDADANGDAAGREEPAGERRSLVPQARDAARRGPLQIAEPMYFAIGGGDQSSAKFQLSLSYRLFDQAPDDEPGLSWVEHLHFGYTQTSLWDLSAESNPFEDSSYRPSLYYQTDPGQDGLRPKHLRIGLEHESNGKDGAASRSVDTLFARGFWEFRLAPDRHLYLGPKVYGYLSKADENDDIEEFRGFADYFAAFGDPNGWMATATARLGTAGKGSLELELSYPVREDFLPRLGGYFYAQVFTGYGETILNYDRRKDTSLRIGYAIVR